jgi:hypothetical protein
VCTSIKFYNSIVAAYTRALRLDLLREYVIEWCVARGPNAVPAGAARTGVVA